MWMIIKVMILLCFEYVLLINQPQSSYLNSERFVKETWKQSSIWLDWAMHLTGICAKEAFLVDICVRCSHAYCRFVSGNLFGRRYIWGQRISHQQRMNLHLNAKWMFINSPIVSDLLSRLLFSLFDGGSYALSNDLGIYNTRAIQTGLIYDLFWFAARYFGAIHARENVSHGIHLRRSSKRYATYAGEDIFHTLLWYFINLCSNPVDDWIPKKRQENENKMNLNRDFLVTCLWRQSIAGKKLHIIVHFYSSSNELVLCWINQLNWILDSVYCENATNISTTRPLSYA